MSTLQKEYNPFYWDAIHAAKHYVPSVGAGGVDGFTTHGTMVSYESVIYVANSPETKGSAVDLTQPPGTTTDWIPLDTTYYFDSINSMAAGLSDHVVGAELTTTGFYAAGDGGGSRFVKMAAVDAASRPAEIVGKIVHQGTTEFYASVTNMQERTIDIRRFGVVLDEPVGQAARFNTATLPSNEHWLNIPEGKTLILDAAVDVSKLNLDGLGTIRCGVDEAISCSGDVNIWNTQIDANQKRMPLDFTNNNVLTKSVVFGGKAKIYNSHSETFNIGCRITGNYAVDIYNLNIDGVTARANNVTGDGDGATAGIQLAGPITYCDIHNITVNNINSLNALDIPIYEDADGIKVQTRTSDNSQPDRLRIRHGVFTNCGKRALKMNATMGNVHVTVDEMHVDSQWVGTVNDSTVAGSSDIMLCAISMNTGTLELDRLILTGGRIGRAVTGGSGVFNITINDISQNQEDSLFVRGEPTGTVVMKAAVSGVFDNLFISRIHGSCYVSQMVYAERIKNVTINDINGACGLIGVETLNCDHLSIDKMNLSILDDAGLATAGTRYGVYSNGDYITLDVSNSRMVGGGIRSFVRAAGTPATNTRIKVTDSYCDSASRSFIEDAGGTIPDGTYNTRPIDVVRCYESGDLVGEPISAPVQTAAFTAIANTNYPLDATALAATSDTAITLPASGTVSFYDQTGSCTATRRWAFTGLFQGQNSTVYIDSAGGRLEFVYRDAVYGWEVR